MQKVIPIFISTKTTIALLFVFGLSMAVATFVENSYDTLTAKMLIYDTKWFELVMLLLALNFIGNIKRYNLLSKDKLAILTFHLAFIIMLIGAGITRYTGYEGTMRIREGQQTNLLYTSSPYLYFNVQVNDKEYVKEEPKIFNWLSDPEFHYTIETDEVGDIDIKYKDFIRNAVESYEENAAGGVNRLELIVAGNGERSDLHIKEGELKSFNGLNFAYNNKTIDGVTLMEENGLLKISCSQQLTTTDMNEANIDTIAANTVTDYEDKRIYQTGDKRFIITKKLKKAIKSYASDKGEQRFPDALIVDISYNGKSTEHTILGGNNFFMIKDKIQIEGAVIETGYGNKPIVLPFSLMLKDFILDRYPGSMSPSSFASEVVLIDERTNLKKDYKIFMNNVLDYEGYRFFQSSYDTDEKGTILSVNHDFVGTWVTYFGYLLMGIGFVFIFFAKKSRFATLIRSTATVRAKRKALAILLFLGLGTSGFSQSNVQQAVSEEHAEKASNLVIQTYSGRFAPLHTLAYDVLHKISRKHSFDIPGKGTLDGMQVFLDMSIDSVFWKQQKIIYIREQSVRDIVGIEGKYASFYDFFDSNSQYKLQQFAEEAFRKVPSTQNKFDKEVIKVDERLNIFMLTYQNLQMKIFPVQNSINNKWIHYRESQAFIPLQGGITIINEALKLKVFNYNSIMQRYINELQKAVKTNDYAQADLVLGYIGSMQRQAGTAELIPTKSKIDLEVYYNKAQIFIFLKYTYALLSVILLFLAFVENLSAKPSKILTYTLYGFIALLVPAFLYHTYGMALRWYLTGHAPWSNGYEALILVAWGGLLSGFLFIRYSKITIAATVLLAFFVLMTASHSSYDPQLTNLQPVLKSYWLIIHVATLTISYGFFGLAFILGIFNLLLLALKNQKNNKRISLLVSELTNINEMNLIIGITLATVGTFLGGIWANESWGRYWGWDAKETWALIILITYGIVLHFRLIPKMKNDLTFNIGAIIGFASVLMTFLGVNYYFTKGMHSYASGSTPVFPMWAWGLIAMIFVLITLAVAKEKSFKNK